MVEQCSGSVKAVAKFKPLLNKYRKELLNSYLEALYASIAAERLAERVEFWELDWLSENLRVQLESLKLWNMGRVDYPVCFRNSDDSPSEDKNDWTVFLEMAKKEFEKALAEASEHDS